MVSGLWYIEAMTESIFTSYLHRRMESFGTWRAFAKHLGVSPQFLHDCKVGARKPSDKILEGLGLEKVTTYRKVK